MKEKESYSSAVSNLVHEMTQRVYDYLNGREKIEFNCFVGEQKPLVISVVPEFGTLFVSINGEKEKQFLDLNPIAMGTIVDRIQQLQEDQIDQTGDSKSNLTPPTKSLRCDNGQYQIFDRLTGKSHSLDCGEIDMSKLTGNQVKSLLNGKDVPFGSGQKLSLVKGTGGFALSIGKQVVSLADSEAGL